MRSSISQLPEIGSSLKHTEHTLSLSLSNTHSVVLAHIPWTHVICKLSASSGHVVDFLVSNIIHRDVSTHAALQEVLH